MKRSEMVNKISNLLYEATEGDISITLEEADLFLSFMEKAGMAPPMYVAHPEAYNRSEGTYGFEVHEWEDE